MMYTIISGTNRPGSNTARVAQQYFQMFADLVPNVRLVSLEAINPLTKDGRFQQWEREVLHPAEKFVFVSPEYNGSIPGILKLVIDAADWKKAWKNKKAMLVGVSTGRAGNLRGMDHLVSILHHMNIRVMPHMIPISQVDRYMDDTGIISDKPLLELMQQQVKEFIDF